MRRYIFALLALGACHRGSVPTCELAGPVGGSVIAIERSGTPSIDGRVVTVGGAPIQGAIASITGTARAASTDANGHFRIDRLPVGVYELRVRSIGYAGATRNVTFEKDQGLKALAALEVNPVRLTDECGFVFAAAAPRPWWKFW